MVRTSFVPQKHGFKFANTFANNRFFGPLHLEFGGRCGGMVYAALDYFYNNIPIPSQTDLPIEGSILSTYISARQEKSTWNEINNWVELSVNPFGWRTNEFWNWGIQDSGGGRLEQLRREIDNGRPAPLGLYNAHDAIKHHQVLAVGYEGSGVDLRIFVYDPNEPDKEKILKPFPHPTDPRYDYEDSPGEIPQKKWLTYFVDLHHRVEMPWTEGSGSSSLDLSNQNLSGQNLNNKDFRRAICINTNFTGATINQADFSMANLERAVFQGANLRNSNFSGANLNKANFYGADLKDTRFLNAIIRNGNFTGADLKLAKLTGANLELCEFYGADLHRSTLASCICDRANFYGASLNTTDLSGARLRGANLTGADLRNANLSYADFSGANLRGANLAGANKTGTIGL